MGTPRNTNWEARLKHSDSRPSVVQPNSIWRHLDFGASDLGCFPRKPVTNCDVTKQGQLFYCQTTGLAFRLLQNIGFSLVCPFKQQHQTLGSGKSGPLRIGIGQSSLNRPFHSPPLQFLADVPRRLSQPSLCGAFGRAHSTLRRGNVYLQCTVSCACYRFDLMSRYCDLPRRCDWPHVEHDARGQMKHIELMNNQPIHLQVSVLCYFGPRRIHSLPEFMDFKLFGKTILVVNKKFKLFFGQPIREVSQLYDMFTGPVWAVSRSLCLDLSPRLTPKQKEEPIGGDRGKGIEASQRALRPVLLTS